MVTLRNMMFAIEAKSTASKVREVPFLQLHNAATFLDLFPLYDEKYVCAAWYFMRKTKQKFDDNFVESNRKIRIYICTWGYNTFKLLYKHLSKSIVQIDCNYEGTIRYRTPRTLRRKNVSTIDVLDESDLNMTINNLYPHKKFRSLEDFVSYYRSSDSFLYKRSEF
jgi:hypothetical protein